MRRCHHPLVGMSRGTCRVNLTYGHSFICSAPVSHPVAGGLIPTLISSLRVRHSPSAEAELSPQRFTPNPDNYDITIKIYKSPDTLKLYLISTFPTSFLESAFDMVLPCKDGMCGKLKLGSILSAVITRIVFCLHSLIAFWLIMMNGTRWEPIYWLLLSGLVGLAVETIVTLYVKKGAEYKW